MAFSVGFRLNLLGKPQSSLIPSVSSNSFAVSSFSAKNVVFDRMKKLKNSIAQTRALAEGPPSELVEDSKFVPLNANDPSYGPPALLLLGFEVCEAEKIRQFLKELDGEFMEEAMNTRQPNLEQVKWEEMMMFIDAFPETGLEPAVFATFVPNSADKPFADFIDEIMGNHEMLTAQQSGST